MGNVVTIRRVGVGSVEPQSHTVVAFETETVGYGVVGKPTEFVRILGFYESEEAALLAWPSGVVQDAGEYVRG